MTERKRPLWPFLTAALIGLPVLYVLSFGPVAWLSAHSLLPEELLLPVVIFYSPLIWAINSEGSPRWLQYAILWYLSFWG